MWDHKPRLTLEAMSPGSLKEREEDGGRIVPGMGNGSKDRKGEMEKRGQDRINRIQ